MNEERKLQKAKITLMRNSKFALLSGILMVGRTSVDDNVPTACTDGRDERYGREFIKGLRDPELAFVVAHEAAHKMYRHLSTWRKLSDENRELTNHACDYVINLMLKDLDPSESVIAMPVYRDGPHVGKRMGLVDERFRGMNTKQVYDILKQEQEENGHQGGGIDEHDWDGAKEMTEAEAKELAREIDQAIRQGLMAHQKQTGKGGGTLSRELQDLLEPKVDWRQMLREYVKAVCRAKDTSSWRRVNRRYLSLGMYMPSIVGERVGHIVIGVDTSGSIGGPELAEFLAEVKGIAEEVNPEKVDLIYWDSEVAGHEEYTELEVPNIVSSTKPRGGGGTSPSCMSDYLKEKRIEPECIIMLTDGYVGNDWGHDWPAPVMWTITGGNKVTAPNGKTIHI